MRRWLNGRRFLSDNRGDMVEGALTFPLMALVALALVNLALAGFSATTANHAAGYGARAGSVAQADPAGRALEASQQALRSGIGDYAVRVAADTYPGRRGSRRGGLDRTQLLRQPDAALRRVQRPAQRHGGQRVPQGGLVKRACVRWLGPIIAATWSGMR